MSKGKLRFKNYHAFKCSDEIDSITNYWLNKEDEEGKRLFNSYGHLIRSAIIRLDKELTREMEREKKRLKL